MMPQEMNELSQKYDELLNKWEELEHSWQIQPIESLSKIEIGEIVVKLKYMQLGLSQTSLKMLEHLDNEFVAKLYDDIKNLTDKVDDKTGYLEYLWLGNSIRRDANCLDDELIKQAITESTESTSVGEDNPVVQIVKMCGLIFVSYFAGVIVYGILEDVLPLEIFGSSYFSSLIAAAGAFVCGSLFFAAPFVCKIRDVIKKKSFVEREYKESKLFRAEFIKIVEESASNYYVYFKDENGKECVSPISYAVYDTIMESEHDVKYVYVLRYPKYNGGFGYLAFAPTDFTNNSSIQIVD